MNFCTIEMNAEMLLSYVFIFFLYKHIKITDPTFNCLGDRCSNPTYVLCFHAENNKIWAGRY